MARGAPGTTIASTAKPPGTPKGAPVKHFRALSLLIGALALAAVVAGTALATAQTKVTFKGTYVGKVTEKVDGQNVTGTMTAIAMVSMRRCRRAIRKSSGVRRTTVISVFLRWRAPGDLSRAASLHKTAEAV